MSGRHLIGTRFFLEIGQRQDVDEIQDLIKVHGGKIETFLWKNVDYYMIDASSSTTLRKPLNKVKTKCADNAHKHFTRAQEMVALARNQSNPSKLTRSERAKLMGIRIITVDAFYKWVKEIDQLKDQQRNILKNKPSTSKSNQSIIKVEDNSQRYCPEVKKFKTGLPQLKFTGLGSPFEYLQIYNLRSTQSLTAVNTCKLTTALECESKKVTKLMNGDRKPRFCELSPMNYNSQDVHLKSLKHQESIKQKYEGVDELISAGQSFHDFIRHREREASSSNEIEGEKEDKTIPSSDITTSAITPIEVSIKNGYGIVRKRKRKHPNQQNDLSSNQSSVESIDTDCVCISGKRKLISLETKRFVAIAQLQQRLRRAERPISERGSNLVEIPTFHTAANNDFERISNAPKNITHRVTRQTKSVIYRSKDHVQIRRSKRLATDCFGTKRIRVPILVAEPQPQQK